jgi:hypothetical protein
MPATATGAAAVPASSAAANSVVPPPQPAPTSMWQAPAAHNAAAAVSRPSGGGASSEAGGRTPSHAGHTASQGHRAVHTPANAPAGYSLETGPPAVSHDWGQQQQQQGVSQQQALGFRGTSAGNGGHSVGAGAAAAVAAGSGVEVPPPVRISAHQSSGGWGAAGSMAHAPYQQAPYASAAAAGNPSIAGDTWQEHQQQQQQEEVQARYAYTAWQRAAQGSGHLVTPWHDGADGMTNVRL